MLTIKLLSLWSRLKNKREILNIVEQFFGGKEHENSFEKSKHFITYWLKAFASDNPQSIKRQKKGLKEHDQK